ncbi:MAG TPA: PD-(D/E)XK nuclease family protein [Anaerolineaceae bacterium]|nr:PD-(D/E)XK nuclease family protein [Anaerolineaceae bacterium]HPN51963.1 PD-(D/E)XK nuclease family protein [Anaerolineaceae bacterium]
MPTSPHVRLIVAPPAAGKTYACIQQIHTFLSEHPLARIWVIVPDRLQAAAFRQRLAETGGVLGVTVSPFYDFYRHILEKAGVFLPVTSPPLQHRLVQEAINQAARAGKLTYFASIEKQPGFVMALNDAFTELKRGMVNPDDFQLLVASSTPAHRELALLYSHYQTCLQSLRWVDSEDLSQLALKVLDAQPGLLSDIKIFVIDGFDSFTGSHLATLNALSRQEESKLWVTFPGEIGSNRQAHRRFSETIASLIEKLSPQITSLSHQSHLPPDLQQIEKVIFEPFTHMEEAPRQNCLLLEARSPTDEAREALRWLKSLVVRQGISLSACAIFTPDPLAYHPALRAAAAEFGMPVHFTLGDPLSQSPAISAVKNLLTLPAKNFQTRLLMQVLRSPYFDLGFEPGVIDSYELISQVAQITEGIEQWVETWDRLLPETSLAEADFDEERILQPLPRGSNALQLQQKLQAFFGLLAFPSGSQTRKEWIAWVENLLEKLQFSQRVSSERDQTACEIFRETLRALILSESVVGERQVEYAQFLNDLEGTLESVLLSDDQHHSQPALMVGRITEARGVRFQAVAILGLSEGILPIVEHPDPFMDEQLRQELGLEARLNREQTGLFYQAVTRADHYLLLTRPYLSDDGEDWQPSPFWKAVQACFKTFPIVKIRPDDPRPLSEAASSQELLFWAVRNRALPARFSGPLAQRWEFLHHARDVLAARRTRIPDSPFEGMSSVLKPMLAEKYGPAHTWSPSRLESYRVCPFQFYVTTALALEPRMQPQLGLDAAQLGSLLHKILEDTFKFAANPSDLNSVLSSLATAASQQFARAPKAYGFRPSPLWDYEQKQLVAKLEQTVAALVADQKWTPIRYEQAFGIHGTPSLMIDLDDGERIFVHGIIDRVDRDRNGDLRVLDYKTGSSHMENKYLTEGRRLQLPIYALAARDALKLGEPVDGIYWKILAAEPGQLRLETYKTNTGEGVAEAVSVLKNHLRHIVDGVRSAKFPPNPPRDGCPAYCPAAAWCWHFQEGGYGG